MVIFEPLSTQFKSYLTSKTVYLFSITLLLLFAQCTAQTSSNKLGKKQDFEDFCGPPLTDKYGEITAVKVVYDINTKKLHYINHHRFKFHHEYVSHIKGYPVDLSYFNSKNYSASKEKRDYLLANINYIKSQDLYAMELSPTDLMHFDQIEFLYKAIAKTTFFGNKMVFLLNNGRLNANKETLETLFPIIQPKDIYKNLSYQPISKYESYGIVRFMEDVKKEKDDFKPTDILILKNTPLELPRVAGVIVSEFQTPLSHLTILGQNRKIPICAMKQAFSDSSMQVWDGKMVRLDVRSNTFELTLAKSLQDLSPYRPRVNLKASLIEDSLIDVARLGKHSSRYVGNKAGNFAKLYKLSNKYQFKTPEGAFAIPFYFYNEHISQSEAKDLIQEIITSEDQDSIKVKLKRIRSLIKNTPIDPTLLASVEQKMRRDTLFHRMRFRSSTNAEDAYGFSGAGLYTSKTGILGDEKKSVEKAIKKVWASLWSYPAYMERVYFNMNQKNLYMGILVHRSFPNEAVNGVAITKNIYREGNYGYVVNAQLGNENVVQPRSGVVNDQFICYPPMSNDLYVDKNVIDIITTGNLNNGQLVMTEVEIETLAKQLDYIKRYFAARSLIRTDYVDFGVDVEFKLNGENRQLYIKQARFYND